MRVVRATRPDVIVTMNPSATEGNHGNHQQAAMFAVEAYFAAGDPNRFPEHAAEGFEPWQPRRILRAGATGSGASGPGGVAAGYTPRVASDVVFGCWNGTYSEKNGKLWSQLLDQARWAYVTQGWADRAPTTTDPERISNSWYTVIHSRSPLVDPTSGGEAALRGAALPISGGLPLGTLIEVRPERFEVVAGQRLEVAVTVTAAGKKLPAGFLTLSAPDGWRVPGRAKVPALKEGRSHTVTLEVTAPADATPGTQLRLEATLTAANGSGTTFAPLRVAGAVESTITPLEEIQSFRSWTKGLNMKHLDVLLPELFPLGQGRTRTLDIVVENFSSTTQSGSVSLTLPAGFEASPASVPYSGLAAGTTTTVSFEVTNTDTTLPTANRGPNGGSWPVSVVATSSGGTATREVVMNLVPSYEVQRAATTPVIDGVRDPEEYPGDPIPASTIWDGSPAGGTSDSISCDAWITHDDENFYLFISVQDDIRGTILPVEDNKRQRRTDSVEIYFDPRGDAPHTGYTFIGGIMPSMDSMTGAPGVGRDRDNWQGEAHITAPGMEVAVVMADNEADYTGYDMEVKIPFDVLPDNIDPQHVGFNVVVNDSDTQNKAAQRRVGWSTFPGMRADPWRWGILTVPGVPDLGSQRKEPIIPDTAARSVESPQSILQSATDLVPLGGFAPTAKPLALRSAVASGDTVTVKVDAPQSGTVRAYVWDGTEILGSSQQQVGSGAATLTVTAPGAAAGATVAVSFETSTGAVSAAATALTTGSGAGGVSIVSPAQDQQVSVPVSVSVAFDDAIAAGSFTATLNGRDVTKRFTVTSSGATASLKPGDGVRPGGNRNELEIRATTAGTQTSVTDRRAFYAR